MYFFKGSPPEKCQQLSAEFDKATIGHLKSVNYFLSNTSSLAATLRRAVPWGCGSGGWVGIGEPQHLHGSPSDSSWGGWSENPGSWPPGCPSHTTPTALLQPILHCEFHESLFPSDSKILKHFQWIIQFMLQNGEWRSLPFFGTLLCSVSWCFMWIVVAFFLTECTYQQFRHTKTERTEMSARAYAKGLFGSTAQVYFPPPLDPDPILKVLCSPYITFLSICYQVLMCYNSFLPLTNYYVSCCTPHSFLYYSCVLPLSCYIRALPNWF